MNKHAADVLIGVKESNTVNQRRLADITGYSLGTINKVVNGLMIDGYISPEGEITTKATIEISEKSPQKAIILAAGVGMRMVPINMQCPKALIEVKGEPLIERMIKQLHEVGVTDITVVVGFLKEQFEYLVDEYKVKLVINTQYAEKNNLHSLALISEGFANSYIMPSDIWCEENPFSKNELYSWYMVSDNTTSKSALRVNRKLELIKTSVGEYGNQMIGIAYFTKKDADILKNRLATLDNAYQYENAFWEEALYDREKFYVNARLVEASKYIEINTYEQLREIDYESNQLKSEAISIIKKALHVEEKEITDITVLKKGMTNRSFLFRCGPKRYIMRIPGEGTNHLINRTQEYEVYQIIQNLSIAENVIYMDSRNGYKITEFFENARTCNSENISEVRACINALKSFHKLGLKVNHQFDLFKQIEFYEKLRNGHKSMYRDYFQTKKNVFSLKEYIDRKKNKYSLSHIDAVPDNFIITDEGNIKLIDWEYAAMQDPHIDIAMFAIYSLYDRTQIDSLIDTYFEGECSYETRVKIYCYVSACGLLWSNWCEYKGTLGIEFGEYSIRQYRYAKEYYRIATIEMEKHKCIK